MKKILIGAFVVVTAVVIVVIFHGPPQAQALANPASVYCIQVGGTEQIVTAADGSQDGFCHLPNGTTCNSWDLYRGSCPGFSPANSGVLYDTNGVLLHEGDLISANTFGDPDIFIIHFKPHDSFAGYKRLFLNPVIFNFYGHLGGFRNVHPVTTTTRDLFETSGLFRNCETNDQKVWATEVTGEDAGIFHHVQMTGEQALAEDPHFFDRVFCINTHEDNFYARSITPYYHLSSVPPYFRRACQVRPACLDSVPRCMIPEPMGGWCPSPTPTPPYACATEGNSPGAAAGTTYICCNGTIEAPIRDVNGNTVTSSTENVYRCVKPGCYYQQVQCIRAPCDPILVCPTPTPYPTPTTCNAVCSTDADCGSGLICYQPPFYCPPGQYCAQVMPAKVCRSPSNTADTTCSGSAMLKLGEENANRVFQISNSITVTWTYSDPGYVGDRISLAIWRNGSSMALGTVDASAGSLTATLAPSTFWSSGVNNYYIEGIIYRAPGYTGTTLLRDRTDGAIFVQAP